MWFRVVLIIGSICFIDLSEVKREKNVVFGSLISLNNTKNISYLIDNKSQMYSNNWYYNKVQQQQQHQQQQSGGSVQVPVAGGGSMNDSYESQFQVIERDPLSGNVRKIEEKREQHSKRTTQTTTTTTSTSQPMLLNTADLQGPTVASVSPVHFADSHAHLTYVQQPVPVYAIATGPCLPIPVVFIYIRF